MKYKLLFLAVAAMAYCLYQPLPDYLNEMSYSTKAVILLMTSLQKILPVLAEVTGLGSGLGVTRSLRELFVLSQVSPSSLNVDWQDTRFDGVLVRVYTPRGLQAKAPGILYLRGGGFIVNTAIVHQEFCARLAASAKAVVVSVEYRLAPEHPFPAALDDSETALRHFVKHAQSWNVDETRIGIAGDSAGGNLAAGLALRVQKEKLPHPLKFQVLIYPYLSSHNFTTVSQHLNRHDALLPRDTIHCIVMYLMGYKVPDALLSAGYTNLNEVAMAMTENNHTFAAPGVLQRINKILDPAIYDRILTDSDAKLLSEIPKHDDIKSSSESTQFTSKDLALSSYLEKFLLNPDFSPLLAPSLKGLPTTYIIVCEYDVIRDDGLLYAERLKDAGVPTYVKRYDKYHGYSTFEPQKSVQDITTFLQTIGF